MRVYKKRADVPCCPRQANFVYARVFPCRAPTILFITMVYAHSIPSVRKMVNPLANVAHHHNLDIRRFHHRCNGLAGGTYGANYMTHANSFGVRLSGD
jgi:hypothetical protein